MRGWGNTGGCGVPLSCDSRVALRSWRSPRAAKRLRQCAARRRSRELSRSRAGGVPAGQQVECKNAGQKSIASLTSVHACLVWLAGCLWGERYRQSMEYNISHADCMRA
jgi:hypothetical protein